jgi:uncharacterized protein (TIGR02246 family)
MDNARRRMSSKPTTCGILAAFGLAALSISAPALARTTNDEAAIRRTMAAYNLALNGGSTAAVMPLYTRDAVFMAPYSESSIGPAAVKKAYDAVFHELKFNVRFTIREVVQLSPTYAYVRTNSAGSTRHASTGRTTSEANQELFILQKGGDGRWRIARYSFSPTNPPRG